MTPQAHQEFGTQPTVVVVIQPEQQPGLTLPKPYFVDAEGMIGRQDYWKGAPTRLIGFQRDLAVMTVDLEHGLFFDHPDAAIGLYPVFEDARGNMSTLQAPIASTRRHTPGA